MARFSWSSAARLLYCTVCSSTAQPSPSFSSTGTMARFSRSYSSAAGLLSNTVYSSTAPLSPSSSLLSSTFHLRRFSAGNIARAKVSKESVERLRNIWISGLIDTDKMMLEERLLFYVSRINGIHELRGREAVEHMIEHCGFENYCTYCTWKDHKINIIDTPGPVNFTIEADRALRVFDGAILVLCSVGGVQSQSIIVDRQMRRYEIPRLAFIDNLDRMRANPWKVLNQARSKLRHHSAAIQVPIGLEDDFKGLVDLVQLKAYYFHGSNGEKVVAEEVPADMEALVSEKRRELIEIVSQVDDKLAEAFFSDKPISAADLEEAVRRATVARKFIPVFMGSAFKNKGLQSLLDGVLNYLPCPIEVGNYVLDQTKNEKVKMLGSRDGPLVALAFKLDDYWFCELTYLRIYKGVIRTGDVITNVNTGEKIKVPCLFRMHSFEMKEIQEAHAGQIVAVFGAESDCVSGDTYTDGYNDFYESPLAGDVINCTVDLRFWRAQILEGKWVVSSGDTSTPLPRL